MNKAEATNVIVGDEMEWGLMPNHWHLYHREVLNASQADELGVRVSSVLWEKIGVGGAVLPHYHDVAEIIHITAGEVKLLRDGTWTRYKAGDTFHVPAGVVHSVACVGDTPSEQISIFLPVESDAPRNAYFNTHLVEDVYTASLGS